MKELKTFHSERIYWAVEQVEREAGDIDNLHLDENLFYIKSEADAVIAKLKSENERLNSIINADPKSIEKDVMKRVLIYPKGYVSIDDAASLVAELRATRRALWIARAHFCARSCEFFNGIMSHCLIGKEDLYNRCEKKRKTNT